MDFKIHPFSNAKVTSWSGGKTAELFIFPPQSRFADRDFDFRISSATIEVEASGFTPLPAYNRLLAVLEGEMEIFHEGKYTKHLTALESDLFHGSWKTSSQGKVRDLNVIYSARYVLDFNLESLTENKTIVKTSDFLLLFMLNDEIIDGTQVKKYDLLEIIADEIELGKGLSCFEIRLNRI